MLTLPEVLADFGAYAGYGAGASVTVDSRSASGESPLHWMSTLGDHVAIDLLARAGADLNAQDKGGNAPIHSACASRQATAVRALIDAGANLRLENGAGLTALDVATQQGYRPCIELLAGQL
jgi:ankyrin repeat protein